MSGARILVVQDGGDDYLVKPFAMAELLARVEALLRRAGHHTAGRLEFGDLVVDVEARIAVRGGHQLELTKTEFAVGLRGL